MEKRIILLIAILAGFLTPFDGSAVNIALPSIGTEFSMDAIALSWVAIAYLRSSALFLVPFGKIADLREKKDFHIRPGSFYCCITPHDPGIVEPDAPDGQDNPGYRKLSALRDSGRNPDVGISSE